MIDIYHSRRTKYKKCYYYKRDKGVNDLSKYVLMSKPEGHFYARPYSPRIKGADSYNNMYMINNNKITLQTEDEITGLEKNDIVFFMGHAWVVDSDIQEIPHEKETEFSNELHSTKIISLRR